jgi:hypothetical protein
MLDNLTPCDGATTSEQLVAILRQEFALGEPAPVPRGFEFLPKEFRWALASVKIAVALAPKHAPRGSPCVASASWSLTVPESVK